MKIGAAHLPVTNPKQACIVLSWQVYLPTKAIQMIKKLKMTLKSKRKTPKTVGGGLRFTMCIWTHFTSLDACKFIFDKNELEVSRG
jgi:hypothetical protein